MIYGFTDPVTLVRLAVLADVKKFEGRKPDKQDREAIENKLYVIAKWNDSGMEKLWHAGRLRADDGWAEISDAIEALSEGKP